MLNNWTPSVIRARNKNWFTIQAKEVNGEKVGVIDILDSIDPVFGIDGNELVAHIKALEVDTITVALNSPGGDVFQGLAIYNALKSHPAKVKTYNMGLAASIASIIQLAGDEIYQYESALTMWHRAWAISAGNSEELNKTAKVLDKIDDQLVNIYERSTGKDKVIIENLMAEETWFNSAEAREMGIAETIEDKTAKTQMAFDLSLYRNAPDNLKKVTNQDILKEEREKLKAKKELETRNEMERRIRLSVAMDNI